jgi:hypothetical protein
MQRLVRALVGAIAARSLGACALVLGIDPPILDDREAAVDGAVVVDTGLDDRAETDGGAPDEDADAAFDAAPCTADGGTDATSVFVALPPLGTSDPNCGTKDAPCGAIQLGIDHAKALGQPTVFVQHGTYVESVALKPGVSVEGGWEVVGTTWSRSCVTPLHDAVVIQAPDANDRTVSMEVAGTATLRKLTLRSKPSSAVALGESIYGVVVHGAAAEVVLDDVAIEVVGGGAGMSGARGPSAGAADAGCSVGTGADAALEGAIGSGASAGSFAATGYVPGAGASSGEPGSSGENGAVAVPFTCVNCVTCTAITCGTTTRPSSCGTNGASGCGGGPGGGGLAGESGGASVGIYVWDGKLTTTSGRVKAGPGGNGGAGGTGGAGGSGGIGALGDAGPSCISNCSVLVTCNGPSHNGEAGLGGNGGSGSNGGAGGGGAGGPSYAIVQGGSAVVSVDPTTTLEHGAGGVSDGNGAPGAAGDRFP